MAIERALEPHSAADRILRSFGIFVGLGYVAYLVLSLPAIDAQTSIMATWWTPLALVTSFGPGIMLLSIIFRRGAVLVPRLATLCGLGYLIAIGTWPIAWNGVPVDSHLGIWLCSFPGLSSLAAAAAWRARWVFAHLLVVTVAAQIANHAARDPKSPLLPELVNGLGFSAVVVGAAVMAIRTGRVMDETRTETFAAAASAAAVEARGVERERFDALIHDGVMATLLSAGNEGVNSLLRRQSRSTLAQLDRLRVGEVTSQMFDVAGTLAHLRLAATDVDQTIRIRTSVEPGAETIAIPADVARAMGAGLAEAVRNSLRHAGSRAERAISVAVSDIALHVVVADNGVGFDAAAVPPHRLGLAVSIRGRMRQLPGGSATIESRPEVGTRVQLSWIGAE